MHVKTKTIMPILFITATAFAQPDLIFGNGFDLGVPTGYITPLNDTGITEGGNSHSGNNPGCQSNMTTPQDCNTGRDFTHDNDSDGHAGFSFTKLDSNGIALTNQNLSYNTLPWQCTKDNVTGLVWEVKTPAPSDIHYMSTLYRWGGETAIGLNHPNALGTYYSDWSSLVNNSNANNFCGSNNWRVPTAGELGSILNRDPTFNNQATIDLSFFPNTNSSGYWSASPMPTAQYSAYAWVVDFFNSTDILDGRTSIKFVRLVHK